MSMTPSSPMAKPPSMLDGKKRSSSNSSSKSKISAQEALAKVYQKATAAAAARSQSPTPTSTPALSYSSRTTTTLSEDVDELESVGSDVEDGLSFPPSKAAPGSEHIFTTRHSE